MIEDFIPTPEQEEVSRSVRAWAFARYREETPAIAAPEKRDHAKTWDLAAILPAPASKAKRYTDGERQASRNAQQRKYRARIALNPCRIAGCRSGAHSLGRCIKHDAQWRRGQLVDGAPYVDSTKAAQ